VDVNVAMDPALVGTVCLAAHIDPAVDTIELEVEGLSIGPLLLAVTAPAVHESMRSDGDPLVVTHGTNIRPGGLPCTAIDFLFASSPGTL
jgi:hypothetical protein